MVGKLVYMRGYMRCGKRGGKRGGKRAGKRGGKRAGKVPATEGLCPGLIQRPSGGLEISS